MQTTQSTIKVNEEIINERNTQMDQIAKDVETIQDIYKDLALLVQEQGAELNTIADNIEHTVSQTEDAVVQLEKAHKRQKKGCIIF